MVTPRSHVLLDGSIWRSCIEIKCAQNVSTSQCDLRIIKFTRRVFISKQFAVSRFMCVWFGDGERTSISRVCSTATFLLGLNELPSGDVRTLKLCRDAFTFTNAMNYSSISRLSLLSCFVTQDSAERLNLSDPTFSRLLSIYCTKEHVPVTIPRQLPTCA